MTGTATSSATSDSDSVPSVPFSRNRGPRGLNSAHAQKFTAKPMVAIVSMSVGEAAVSRSVALLEPLRGLLIRGSPAFSGEAHGAECTRPSKGLRRSCHWASDASARAPVGHLGGGRPVPAEPATGEHAPGDLQVQVATAGCPRSRVPGLADLRELIGVLDDVRNTDG